MTVIAMTSVAGAPGVTTSAVALAVHWPRPVVLLEADTGAASTVMTGFFRSNLHPSAGGLEKIALASRRGVLRHEDILDPELELAIAVHDLPPFDLPLPTIPDGHRMWVLPAFVNLATIEGNASLWGRLPELLRALSEAGIDVIVDLGRLGGDDVRMPLVDSVDRVIVVGGSTMVDLNRIYRRLELEDLSHYVGRDREQSRWSLVLVKPVAEEVPARDFTNLVMPVIEVLPFDPEGAATFSLGRPDHKPRRNKYRGAIRRLASKLDQLASQSSLDRKAS